MGISDVIYVRTRFLVVDHDEARVADRRRDLRPYASTVAPTLEAARSAMGEGGVVAIIIDERPGDECPLAFLEDLRGRGDRTPILVLLRSGDLSASNRFHLRGARAIGEIGCAPNVRLFAQEVTGVPSEADLASACTTFRRCYRLTPREACVLATAARVTGYAAIGRELGITARTAETHLHRVLDKTGLPNREALVNALLLLARDPTYVVPRMDRAAE